MLRICNAGLLIWTSFRLRHPRGCLEDFPVPVATMDVFRVVQMAHSFSPVAPLADISLLCGAVGRLDTMLSA
jgi:hypothetical protein